MTDFLSRLREEAAEKAKKREEENRVEDKTGIVSEENKKIAEVAEYLGMSKDEVEVCCGSICPHCDTFLDKAIALEELGYQNHLYMNPTQQEQFKEALQIYRNDPKDYEARKTELIERMR